MHFYSGQLPFWASQQPTDLKLLPIHHNCQQTESIYTKQHREIWTLNMAKVTQPLLHCDTIRSCYITSYQSATHVSVTNVFCWKVDRILHTGFCHIKHAELWGTLRTIINDCVVRKLVQASDQCWQYPLKKVTPIILIPKSVPATDAFILNMKRMSS